MSFETTSDHCHRKGKPLIINACNTRSTMISAEIAISTQLRVIKRDSRSKGKVAECSPLHRGYYLEERIFRRHREQRSIIPTHRELKRSGKQRICKNQRKSMKEKQSKKETMEEKNSKLLRIFCKLTKA